MAILFSQIFDIKNKKRHKYTSIYENTLFLNISFNEKKDILSHKGIKYLYFKNISDDDIDIINECNMNLTKLKFLVGNEYCKQVLQGLFAINSIKVNIELLINNNIKFKKKTKTNKKLDSVSYNLDDIEKKFDDMKEYYEDNGYLIIENVLKKPFIDKLNDSIGIIKNNKSRLQDEWKHNRYVKEVAKNKDIFYLLKKLYKDEPLPFQTLNFTKGTTQKEHSDLMHFCPDEDNLNLMCGVWYALEDISDEKGPLIYYPKSHKEKPILDLSNFGGKYTEYEKHLIKLCKERYVQQKGNISKGSIIIWSSNLIHGGHPDRNKESTRKSMVVHYFFESSKYWWSPAISTKNSKNIRPDILTKSRAILR